jgi:adenylosuccinate synthase
VRYAARICGASQLAVMLLDVLTGIEEIKVAVAYEQDGRRINALPSSLDDFEHCQPIYRSFQGWTEDISTARRWEDLPEQARNYVAAFGSEVGVPVTIVSVGPDRRQTILVR